MTKPNVSHTPKTTANAAAVAAQERLVGLCNALSAGTLSRRDQLAKFAAYVKGLVEDGKKSMEQVGWRTLGAQWQGIQNFISDNAWDCGPVWDEITERLAAAIEPDCIVIDEVTDPKNGDDSVGVTHQRCGHTAKVDNCQMAVTSHLSGKKGSGVVGSHLCMPKKWVNDAARRAKAHVPTALVYETQVQLATRLVDRLRAAGLGHLVVLADSLYGCNCDFRMRLEKHTQPFVLEIKSNMLVRAANSHLQPLPPRAKGNRRASDWAYAQSPVGVRTFARQHKAKFKNVSWANPDVTTPGAGKHTSRFAAFQIKPAMGKYEKAYTQQGKDTPANTLLIEWPRSTKDAVKYWLSNMPPETSLERLVELAKRRYRVEQDYRELKGEIGLDKFQGRLYHGFAHHAVCCAAAMLFLTLERTSGHWRRAWRGYVGPRCSYSIATIRRFVHNALATLGPPGSRAGPAQHSVHAAA